MKEFYFGLKQNASSVEFKDSAERTGKVNQKAKIKEQKHKAKCKNRKSGEKEKSSVNKQKKVDK